jgi:nickel-type superoxide dismutase maturation protease
VGDHRTTRYSARAPKCPAAAIGAGLLVVSVVAWAGSHVQRLAVTGSSMEPTLRPGDRVLVWKTTRVRIGDIVAAPDPRQSDRTVLKRASEVGAREVRLVGDNPEHSTDSRHFGPVPSRSLLGKVVYRYAPPGRTGRLSGKEVPGDGGRIPGRSQR